MPYLSDSGCLSPPEFWRGSGREVAGLWDFAGWVVEMGCGSGRAPYSLLYGGGERGRFCVSVFLY